MVNLLLLSKPTAPERPYRGTFRAAPSHIDNLPDDDPANELFFWSIRGLQDEAVVHDLDRARALVQAYERLEPPQHYEIVEVVSPGGSPSVGTKFLGFDLSATAYYSLLFNRLESLLMEHEPLAHQPDLFPVIRPLMRLVWEYFRPQLNDYWLFDAAGIAQFCLDCMNALQQIRPHLWEDPSVIFEVVGLWLVPSSL
jgi:hypothetical protein